MTDSILAICQYVLSYPLQLNNTIPPAIGVVSENAFSRASRLFPPGVASSPQSWREKVPHCTHTSVPVGISRYLALVVVGALALVTLPALV